MNLKNRIGRLEDRDANRRQAGARKLRPADQFWDYVQGLRSQHAGNAEILAFVDRLETSYLEAGGMRS